MSGILADDTLDQCRKAISMVRATIEKFDEEQWRSGVSWFQVPAKVAYHTIECLDYYLGR